MLSFHTVITDILTIDVIFVQTVTFRSWEA